MFCFVFFGHPTMLFWMQVSLFLNIFSCFNIFSCTLSSLWHVVLVINIIIFFRGIWRFTSQLMFCKKYSIGSFFFLSDHWERGVLKFSNFFILLRKEFMIYSFHVKKKMYSLASRFCSFSVFFLLFLYFFFFLNFP